jgi:hypothetical protein
MKQVVRRVAGQLTETFEFEEIDISTEPALEARHGLEIPVLMIDGRKAAKYRVDEASLLRMLRAPANRRRAGDEGDPRDPGNPGNHDDR